MSKVKQNPAVYDRKWFDAMEEWDEVRLNWIKEDSVWLIQLLTYDGGGCYEGKGENIIDAYVDATEELRDNE